MALYEPVAGVYRKVTKKYDTVDGVYRKVKTAYDAVDGVYRKYFGGERQLPAGTYESPTIRYETTGYSFSQELYFDYWSEYRGELISADQCNRIRVVSDCVYVSPTQGDEYEIASDGYFEGSVYINLDYPQTVEDACYNWFMETFDYS